MKASILRHQIVNSIVILALALGSFVTPVQAASSSSSSEGSYWQLPDQVGVIAYYSQRLVAAW